ncbi:phosphoribosylglycinamide formyltransferase [Actinoplanes ianthinogenes]|uniref:phosphoribosylglycinamide formyltransferase 1 n=1 Tax=Actinoplanes ianthinogenes TaxID=122358 RepID=A0ABM7LJN8_9ACTN|nr:formyltransferase family protein [Actinoplanes ianthinogenes]BCJ39458.1 phosphoribosylglycinamide formyltransferase [Actinoplanes ianthinogenes]GGR35962.1 phosphoribosylglycinamide formyltransferase [Actinoplanes ianthinogenes]
MLGNGVHRTFEYICRAILDGVLTNCKFTAVCANRPGAPIFGSAEAQGIPWRYLDGTSTGEIDEQALAFFRQHDVDFVILLGYGRKVGSTLLDAYPDRILNLHSAPLPRFGGQGMVQPVSQAHVLAAGVRFSGPTIHLVDADYDTGQILAHWPVRIRPDDTPESLNARCNLAAMPLYVRTIQDFVHRLDFPDEY